MNPTTSATKGLSFASADESVHDRIDSPYEQWKKERKTYSYETPSMLLYFLTRQRDPVTRVLGSLDSFEIGRFSSDYIDHKNRMDQCGEAIRLLPKATQLVQFKVRAAPGDMLEWTIA
ncbi:hypothetical protein MMC12_003440 [Toensbergia leucococca]|nr:hypothetical protein [Toensbergia leucococca]